MKNLKQGKTIWIVRLDTDSIKYFSECKWIMIPYLVMSHNYVRAPAFQSDRRMNINKVKELLGCMDPLRYGVFLSRRKAEKFRKNVSNYWAGQVYAQS